MKFWLKTGASAEEVIDHKGALLSSVIDGNGVVDAGALRMDGEIGALTSLEAMGAAYTDFIAATPGLVGFWPLGTDPAPDLTPAANVQAVMAQNLAVNPRLEVDQAGWINSTNWSPGTTQNLLRSALPSGALPAPGGAAYGYRINATKSADTATKTSGFITNSGYYIPITPGGQYTFACDVYVATLPADPRFRFDRFFHDIDGVQLASSNGTPATLVAGWNRVVTTITAASTAGIVSMRINPEWITAVASDYGDMYVTNITVAAGTAEPPVVTQTNHPMTMGGSSQLSNRASLLPNGDGVSSGTTTSGFFSFGALVDGQVSPLNDDLYNFSGLAPFSVEAWVKPTTVDSQRFFVAKRHTASTGGWILYQNLDGALRFVRYGSPAGVTLDSGPGYLVADTVTHVAGTFDGTTMRVYTNGVQRASAASATIGDRHGYPLTLFRDADQSGGQYVGYMQNAAIYNRALSADEIMRHYVRGTLAS